MDTAGIYSVVRSIEETNIYKLLEESNIYIDESNDILKKRKCDSLIIDIYGTVILCIRPGLEENYANFLLWHEYGHYLLHYEKGMEYNFHLSRRSYHTEKDANLFAALNLLKPEELEDQNIIDIMRIKGVPEKIALNVYEIINQHSSIIKTVI